MVRIERGNLKSVPLEKLVVVVEFESSEGLKGMAICTLACLPLQSVVPVAFVLTRQVSADSHGCCAVWCYDIACQGCETQCRIPAETLLFRTECGSSGLDCMVGIP